MLLLMVIVGISKFLMSLSAYGDKTNQPSFHLSTFSDFVCFIPLNPYAKLEF